MSEIHEWADLVEANLTHDRGREQSIWHELLCLTCSRETKIPGEHECADCFVGSAHRRDDAERAAILARPRPPYRRWFGQAAS